MSALVGFLDTKTGVGGLGVCYYSTNENRASAILGAKDLISIPLSISWQEFYNDVEDPHEVPEGFVSLFARGKEERYFQRLDVNNLGEYIEYIMAEVPLQ
jgi:hypothetical protein